MNKNQILKVILKKLSTKSNKISFFSLLLDSKVVDEDQIEKFFNKIKPIIKVAKDNKNVKKLVLNSKKIKEIREEEKSKKDNEYELLIDKL